LMTQFIELRPFLDYLRLEMNGLWLDHRLLPTPSRYQYVAELSQPYNTSTR
jgi:hypothetical protein